MTSLIDLACENQFKTELPETEFEELERDEAQNAKDVSFNKRIVYILAHYERNGGDDTEDQVRRQLCEAGSVDRDKVEQ